MYVAVKKISDHIYIIYFDAYNSSSNYKVPELIFVRKNCTVVRYIFHLFSSSNSMTHFQRIILLESFILSYIVFHL